LWAVVERFHRGADIVVGSSGTTGNEDMDVASELLGQARVHHVLILLGEAPRGRSLEGDPAVVGRLTCRDTRGRCVVRAGLTTRVRYARGGSIGGVGICRRRRRASGEVRVIEAPHLAVAAGE